ncbi:RNA polymerase sigma factor RpoE [Caulifigura coniformis]|uniref:RNA polymerase sigma factor RpoE n=1 Tax=Caulifigura coniformis TaxID=2527983 RepID=A0A517SKA5_9PLAN|nr:ECF-type sigma factor [Caulifigura coniformis]QDT56557.1 RNA polymerase sigma factor RpoE [Caulifigura coniformis]
MSLTKLDDSVTEWVDRLRHGDRNAGDLLDLRYRDALLRMTRKKFANVISAAADEDDLVQSVFYAIWSAASRGSLAEVANRDSFWGLLLTITRNKAISRRRAIISRERIGGTAAQFSQIGDGQITSTLSADHTSTEVVEYLLEEQERLLLGLHDESERRVATYKLQGLSHPEIAAEMRVSVRTVERKLALIRIRWTEIRDSFEKG